MTCTLPRPAINCCKQGINTDVCAYQRKPLALWHSGTPVASSRGLWLASRSSNQGTWVSGGQTGGLFESAEHCGTSGAGVAQAWRKHGCVPTHLYSMLQLRTACVHLCCRAAGNTLVNPPRSAGLPALLIRCVRTCSPCARPLY